MQGISCQLCGCHVLVEKFSPQHTSIQWTLAASATCPQLSTDRTRTCSALHDSIDAAVASGALPLSTRDNDVLTRGAGLR
jgi:hypothetical protein